MAIDSVAVPEPEATTEATDDTDEPLSAKQVRRELCALEGRLARVIYGIEGRQARLIHDVDARLKAAESTLADAEDSREALEKSTSSTFTTHLRRIAAIERTIASS